MLKALSNDISFERSIEIAFENSLMTKEARLSALQHWFNNWAELGWFYSLNTITPQRSNADGTA